MVEHLDQENYQLFVLEGVVPEDEHDCVSGLYHQLVGIDLIPQFQSGHLDWVELRTDVGVGESFLEKRCIGDNEIMEEI